MLKRAVTLTLGLALAAGCADRSPTEVVPEEQAQFAKFGNKQAAAQLFENIPVTGTLPGGGTFAGTMTITQLDYVNDELVASGRLVGNATQGAVVTPITQTFEDVTMDLSGRHSVCQILFLDLGPLHLDLLGLVVDLAPVQLLINAVSGPGQLLGNLLCAVVGLLDGPGAVAGLFNLLNNVNNILALLG